MKLGHMGLCQRVPAKKCFPVETDLKSRCPPPHPLRLRTFLASLKNTKPQREKEEAGTPQTTRSPPAPRQAPGAARRLRQALSVPSPHERRPRCLCWASGGDGLWTSDASGELRRAAWGKRKQPKARRFGRGLAEI